MMIRVRFTGFGHVQTFGAGGELVSYRGETGEVREVPEEVAAALAANGFAELLEGEEPAAAKPRAPRRRK